jgi:hypothetical protein
MNKRVGMILTVAMLALGTGQVVAQNKYDGRKLGNIADPQIRMEQSNVCFPHRVKVQGLNQELRPLQNNHIAKKIDRLERVINGRVNQVELLKSQQMSLQNDLASKQQRLQFMNSNMRQILAGADAKIQREQNWVVKHTADFNKAKAKYKKCGNIFCKGKYKTRMNKNKRKLKDAQKRVQSEKKAKNALIAEKNKLPRVIRNLNVQFAQANQALGQEKSKSPSIFELRKKLQGLHAQNKSIVMETQRLRRELMMAEGVLDKCRTQRFNSNVYDVVTRTVQEFKESPSLCHSVDYMVDMAREDFKKQGIKAAADMVCEMILELEELNAEVDE